MLVAQRLCGLGVRERSERRQAGLGRETVKSRQYGMQTQPDTVSAYLVAAQAREGQQTPIGFLGRGSW